MARSIDEKREILRELSSLLAGGASESEQLDGLGAFSVGVRELRGLRNELFSTEIDALRAATVEETFLTHKLRMDGCVRALDDIVTRASTVAEPSAGILAAAVSAIKAKAGILESVMDRGQSLGVIHKAPKTTLKIGGVMIANASNGDLKQLVQRKVAQLERLAGNTSFAKYTDEDDGEIYYDAEDVIETKAIVEDDVEDDFAEGNVEDDEAPVRVKLLA